MVGMTWHIKVHCLKTLPVSIASETELLAFFKKKTCSTTCVMFSDEYLTRESVSLIYLHLQSEVVSQQKKISYLQTGSRFSGVDDALMTDQRRPKDDILSFKKKLEVWISMNERFKTSLVFQSRSSSLWWGSVLSVYKLKVISWNCFWDSMSKLILGAGIIETWCVCIECQAF